MPILDLASLPPAERAARSELFKPLKLGSMTVQHRIALAPLTRNRGKPSEKVGGTWYPWDIQSEYYIQRATPGGLLISEALPVSLQAVGASMTNVPGIWTEEQIQGWTQIVSDVKATGAVFVAQLFHGGRTAGHSPLVRACAPSATRVENTLGGGPGDVPDEMTEADIQRTIGDYVKAAQAAIECGFGGVEIHGGNGYLPDQFLHTNINKRTDKYGGSIENRNRFVLELCDAVAAAIGSDKFALRLAPYGFFNETRGQGRTAQWLALCKELSTRKFAYIHFMEARYDEVLSESTKLAALGKEMTSDFSVDGLPTIAPFREALGGVNGTPVIVAGGYDTENIWDVVDSGKADLVAIGRYFTSNPDLVYRIKHGKPLVKYNRPRFYMFPGKEYQEGYTDFSKFEDNLESEEDRAMFEAHRKRGIVIAKPGWQLEQDGVQLGEIYV